MKIYIALKNTLETIGHREVNTKEYHEYLEILADIERNHEEGTFSKKPTVPKFTGKKTEIIPVFKRVPRIVEISEEDLRYKYGDSLFHKDFPMREETVWVEWIETMPNKEDRLIITDHNALMFEREEQYEDFYKLR